MTAHTDEVATPSGGDGKRVCASHTAVNKASLNSYIHTHQ